MAALLLAFPLIVSAAAPAATESITFDLRTRIGDSQPVKRRFVVPFGSTMRAPAAGSLSYLMEASTAQDGRASVTLTLLDASGNPLPRTRNGGRFVRLPPGGVRAVSYTVCDDRIIQQQAVPEKAARCADLPPMADADPRPDGCLECLGAYEGLPKAIATRARVAPPGTPGTPLVVTGRVLEADGSPRAGVIVYAFQTDGTGVYPDPSPPRSQFSQSHGRLRAWVKSDAEGRYRFDTVEPGTYPDRSEPRHIHMVVIEPGCATYMIEDLHFADDPLLNTIESSRMADVFSGIGGGGIVTRTHDAATGSTRVTRDIHLGEHFANRPTCKP